MSDRILYLEGASGISGDMTVAALLDLGADRAKLMSALASLHLDGYDLVIEKKTSHGIAGLDFDVQLHSEHGHHHHHDGEHQDHPDHHGHAPEHGHQSEHVHRNLADIEAIIDRGALTDSARALAKKIFRIVAEAESEAHGCPVEEVHFHEVGAIDSIVDIVATAVCFDDLNLNECIVTGLSEGSGFVQCQHGALPVPVPAVLNIARAHAIALRRTPVQGEMVTPTGIAIAAALRTRARLPEQYRVQKVGVGLGKRDFGRANMLRAMILSEDESPERVCVLESNIDDSTGEELGFVLEKLLKAGARDVHYLPCFMKKNRPGWLLRILADAALVPALEEIVFRETTTIGVRRFWAERTCMARESMTVRLSVGEVAVKKCVFEGIVRHYPEYESVKALAEATGKTFREIYRLAERAAGDLG